MIIGRDYCIDWREFGRAARYCYRELFRRDTQLVQWHRIEATLQDLYYLHRELNSRNRGTREKARDEKARRDGK